MRARYLVETTKPEAPAFACKNCKSALRRADGTAPKHCPHCGGAYFNATGKR